MCVCVLSFLGYITWNSVERRSVMARTADIQVNANKGRTTHELHREALPEKVGERGGGGSGRRGDGRRNKTGGSDHRTFSLSLRSCLTSAPFHITRVVRDDV